MQRTSPPLAAIAVALAALAGMVDGIAFTGLGGFFASFMSGNTTRLGVGIGTGAIGEATIAMSLVLAFLAGVIVASVINRALPRRRKPAVMAAVTLALLAAAAIGMIAPGPLVLILLALAMGAENGIFQRDGEPGIGLTYMTGTLVQTGQRLADALMGDRNRWGWVPYLMLWLGFAAGVVLGARAFDSLRWDALWIAPAAAALLTLLIGWLTRGEARMGTTEAPYQP